MKRVLSALFVLAISLCMQAKHPVVLGISIENETMESFTSKVESKGFERLTPPDAPGVALSGRFAGYDDCRFYIIPTDISKQVYKVVVALPERTTWGSLSNDFTTITDAYKAKYGTPTYICTDFKSPYEEGDGLEMSAVTNGYCQYYAKWELEGYTIIIYLNDSGSVYAIYTDTEYNELATQEHNQSVSGDI